jgi:hypothetical protein
MIDFGRLIGALASHGVNFIAVGGVAGAVHGAARATYDVDVVYDRHPDNLARLAHALDALQPYLRGAPPGLPFRLDVETLQRGLNFTLTTDAGDLDLLGEVTGGGAYAGLLEHSTETHAFDATFRTVDLPTLIQLKRAAGRPKDFEAIAELELLLELRGSDQ